MDSRREKNRKYGRQWRLKNAEKVAQNARAWRLKNAAYQSQRSKDWQVKTRLEAYEHYGKACVCCGENRWEFLSIDHADGSGAEDRRRRFGRNTGGRLAQQLKAAGWPPGFRTLCFNCNLSLGFHGYCPHGNGLKVEKVNGSEDDANLSLFSTTSRPEDSGT